VYVGDVSLVATQVSLLILINRHLCFLYVKLNVASSAQHDSITE